MSDVVYNFYNNLRQELNLGLQLKKSRWYHLIKNQVLGKLPKLELANWMYFYCNLLNKPSLKSWELHWKQSSFVSFMFYMCCAYYQQISAPFQDKSKQVFVSGI
jgi:hypothetical protein